MTLHMPPLWVRPTHAEQCDMVAAKLRLQMVGYFVDGERAVCR